ncbi:hypothetical protein GCM10023088_51570 [Actinomadura verrucosospora]|uniref:hypothetical protein n=1 Tax=Actinomadura verrucosospora TaxID=46165 RepID=UPI0031EC989D
MIHGRSRSGSPARLLGEIGGRLAQDLPFQLQLGDLLAQPRQLGVLGRLDRRAGPLGLLGVFIIGSLGLIFHERKWENTHGTRIAQPVMIALGLAVAMAIPLLLLLIWVKYVSQHE